MANKYGYLKKFLRVGGISSSLDTNDFYPVKEQDINEAERKLGIKLPSQLREFYEEIGYGFLTQSHDCSKKTSASVNRINSPAMVAAIILEGPDSELILPDAYEDLLPGDLPFFEICDSDLFLIMRPLSDNPNAVWYKNIKIEDSFERFIWRLYYESPWFYDDIIQAHYAQKEG